MRSNKQTRLFKLQELLVEGELSASPMGRAYAVFKFKEPSLLNFTIGVLQRDSRNKQRLLIQAVLSNRA